MSLYLKPKIRDKNLGHEIFNYALYLAFIEAKNPELRVRNRKTKIIKKSLKQQSKIGKRQT